jgi:uncharacterized protein YndB with AHSA1/START domain
LLPSREQQEKSVSEIKDDVSNTADREIVTTRVMDAPRELVFKAWTDPDHLVHWWGPKGFTNTFHEFDLKPGGVWRFVMHGPDGGDYQNESVFVEIVKPERIVFHHVSAPQFQVTVTLAEQAGKTKLTQNLDRLEAQLAKMA